MFSESKLIVQKTQVCAKQGMVTALHPAAAQAGAMVLKQGGNAVDAFLATLFAMNVVEPFMSSLGGHGAALVMMGGELQVLDASAFAPALAYNAPPPPQRGYASVPVPTAAVGIDAIHRRWASGSLRELAMPAIRLAKEGHALDWYDALMIAAHTDLLSQDEPARNIYLRGDNWPLRIPLSHDQPGEMLRNGDLASTLEAFAAQGASYLVKGELGDRIVTAMVSEGGYVRESDFHLPSAASTYPPVTAPFRGYEVHVGPVASAALSTLEMLTILEDLTAEEVPLASAQYYHRIAEAQRVAFFDRETLGDPRFESVPVSAYGDPKLAQLRREDLTAGPNVALPQRDLSLPNYPAVPARALSVDQNDMTSTTHVNVIDKEGNAVAATFTIGSPFGAGVIPPRTGLFLLNTLFQFKYDHQHPNRIWPGKRAVWNASPVIVTRNGELELVIGAPGGPKIPGAVAQVLVNIFVYGLESQQAVEVPRVFKSHNQLFIDQRVNDSVITALQEMGHNVVVVKESFSSVNFARPGVIKVNNGVLAGGIDEWRLGTVVGVN